MKEIKHSVNLKKDSETDMYQKFLKAILKRYSCHVFCFKIKEKSRRQFSSHLVSQNFKAVNCVPDGKSKHIFTEKLNSDNQEDSI